MQTAPPLKRDGVKSNRHRAFRSLFEHDRFGEPLRTFPDHALDAAIRRMNEPPSTLDTPLLAKPMPSRMERAANARKIVESRPVEKPDSNGGDPILHASIARMSASKAGRFANRP
jgi:hypothetical protein